jgi:mitogen-activated protein kinase kinase kinase
MVRISNFFETQLNVPMRLDPKAPPKKRRDLTPLQPDMESRKRVKKQMTPDEMLLWYGKILEAVKMRYRKLQRFAW